MSWLVTPREPCGWPVDRSRRQLDLLVHQRQPSCCRLALVHKEAQLSTAPVHGPSTGLPRRHQPRHELSTQSTGPMTMTRPRRYEFRPEYLGTKDSGSSPMPSTPRITTNSRRQMLAQSQGGTRVDPHLRKTQYRKTQYCVAVNTHACRRAGYR